MAKRVRPGDLLRPPLTSIEMTTSTIEQEAALSRLPESWRTAIEKADEWPFVDPDVAMGTPDPSFSDFPHEDSSLPEVIPFSEFEPWGMMDEETDRDYELFSYHRAQGLSRTQTATARHFGISQVYVSKVATKRNWDERIRAWDEYREKLYTTEVIEGIKKMAKDHADIAAKGITALSSIFEAAIERIDDPRTKGELDEISFRGLLALAEKSARVIPNLMNAERLSRGLPTEISSQIVVHESKVTVTTTDELAEVVFGLQDVLGKMGTGGDSEVVDVEAIEEAELVDQ